MTKYAGEERRENGETKVRFSLWGVLTFLVVLTGICVGYIFADQAVLRKEGRDEISVVRNENRADRQDIRERLIKVETNYTYLVESIAEVKTGQMKMLEVMTKIEKQTK